MATRELMPAPQRDGERDFDFFMGRWAVRHRRLTQRLAGCDSWEEFEGTVAARLLWGGQANIDELARVSSLVEAANINASEEDVEFKMAALFNAGG